MENNKMSKLDTSMFEELDGKLVVKSEELANAIKGNISLFVNNAEGEQWGLGCGNGDCNGNC